MRSAGTSDDESQSFIESVNGVQAIFLSAPKAIVLIFALVVIPTFPVGLFSPHGFNISSAYVSWNRFTASIVALSYTHVRVNFSAS